MKPTILITCFALLLLAATVTAPASAQERVKVENGTLEGVTDTASGVRSFKGVPFAAPPVGDLRWRAPQPPANWSGVRRADTFGPRAMQLPLFGDMVFRSNGMSEDCLYLNVWTPVAVGKKKLPVLVYFYGGGFAAGDGSEPRYDGASLARQGIVTVTVNYRLGLFGFLAHPDLSREASYHGSGNYGLLDQHAALKWVQKNIAAFGGDPKRVTIGGESAGSISVSAQMASPLSKNLIAGAIGESGSILRTLGAVPLADAETLGAKFAGALGGSGGAASLAALRQMPAEQLMQATKNGFGRFPATIDGYFFPEDPTAIFASGRQAHVPLLAGVNSEESGPGGVLGQAAPTMENYRAALARLYPDRADQVFKQYAAATDADVAGVARDLASDRFISYGTYKWVDLATRTGGKSTYYYLFTRPRPTSPPATGAGHSVEIEYALGNLDGNPVYSWTPDDRKVSQTMQAYFANFIKTGSPNGIGLTEWPRFAEGKRLVIDLTPRAEPLDTLRARYDLLDTLNKKP